MCLDNLALSYQGCTQRQCDAVQTLCTCYSQCSACSKQGVQRKACSRHECCPLHKCLVVTSSAMCSPSWRCCLGCVLRVGTSSTSQAGCHDKLNKVYEGVVEGCSLAGARLGVEQAFTEVLAILYSQSLNNCGLVPPQASTVPAQTAWTSPACSNASVARDRVTAQLLHSTCSGIKSTCEHPLQAIPYRGAYLKYVEQCRHNITSHTNRLLVCS
jgi:hypothetical protein